MSESSARQLNEEGLVGALPTTYLMLIDREWTAGGEVAEQPARIPHPISVAGSEPARFLEHRYGVRL